MLCDVNPGSAVARSSITQIIHMVLFSIRDMQKLNEQVISLIGSHVVYAHFPPDLTNSLVGG